MNLANRLINGFLHSELELFKKSFNEPIPMIPEIQDFRGLAIAWVCYYFKLLIDEENRINITNYVEEIYALEYNNPRIQYQIMALEAAAFILTKRQHFATKLLSKCSGHRSARYHVLESAAIICPQINFYNSQIRISVESNIKFGQVTWKESTILYLNTNGSAAKKIEWAKKQSLNCSDYQKEFFDGLLEGNRFYKSSFFVSAMSHAKSYFIFKVMSNPILRKTEQTLFDHMPLDYENLRDQERKHPLSDGYIDFSFLKE